MTTEREALAELVAQHDAWMASIAPDARDAIDDPLSDAVERARAALAAAKPAAPALAALLTDEQIEMTLGAAFNALVASGYSGGMGGETWDWAAARAIEAEVLRAAATKVSAPVAAEPVPFKELPDAIRVPLHRIWSDAGYLIGRAKLGDTDLAVHTIKALVDEVERAVRHEFMSAADSATIAPAAAPAPEPTEGQQAVAHDSFERLRADMVAGASAASANRQPSVAAFVGQWAARLADLTAQAVPGATAIPRPTPEAAAQPVEPTDARISDLAHRMATRYKLFDPEHQATTYLFAPHHLHLFARAVIGAAPQGPALAPAGWPTRDAILRAADALGALVGEASDAGNPDEWCAERNAAVLVVLNAALAATPQA
jgi:hypothetical protein